MEIIIALITLSGISLVVVPPLWDMVAIDSPWTKYVLLVIALAVAILLKRNGVI